MQIDLKKIKNLTLVKDVKNLAAPLSHNLPILVLDCPDRSLYLQSSAEKAGCQSTWSTTNTFHFVCGIIVTCRKTGLFSIFNAAQPGVGRVHVLGIKKVQSKVFKEAFVAFRQASGLRSKSAEAYI